MSRSGAASTPTRSAIRPSSAWRSPAGSGPSGPASRASRPEHGSPRGRGVDLVVDSLGADVLPRSFDALRPFGRVINIGEAAGYPDFPVRPKLYERSTALAGFELLHAGPGSARWWRGVRYVLSALA